MRRSATFKITQDNATSISRAEFFSPQYHRRNYFALPDIIVLRFSNIKKSVKNYDTNAITLFLTITAIIRFSKCESKIVKIGVSQMRA